MRTASIPNLPTSPPAAASGHVPEAPPEPLADAALAFVATGDAAEDARLAALARAAGVVTNVVDAPDLCDAFTPSIVDRDPLVVAIGTEGAAPVLARQVKTAVETMLEPRLGETRRARRPAARRGCARALPPSGAARFWAWAFSGAPRAAHARGAEREAARLLKAAIAAGDVGATGRLSSASSGPGRARATSSRCAASSACRRRT